MEGLCFPDPEIDKLRVESGKQKTLIKHLEAKLTKAQKTIEMLENTKRKIHEEIIEREEKRKRLHLQAIERDTILQGKWKALSTRYGFPLDPPFSLMTLLPTEVLVHIISMVPIHDILLSLCTVNKTFREIIHLNSLWHNLYDIYWKKVKIPPIPRCNDGSGKDWRGVVVQKYRIENNWKRGRHSTVTIGDGVMVSCLDFMNTTLATGSPDKVVRLWDMKDGSCLRSMSGHFGGVECLQLDFPRGRVVTGSRDGNIKIWDITRPIGEELVMTLNHDMSYVTCLQIQDSMLISGVGSGNIFVWDLNTGTCINRIQGHNKIVSTLQFRGKQLISGSRDKSIKVWDLTGNLNTGTLLSEVSVEKIQWKDDLLMNIEETAISAYSVSLLGRHSSYDGHNHWVRGFQFKKNMLVSASEDIKVWSVKDKKIECALTDHLAFVNCFKFDDQKLVSSSSDRKVRISNFS